MAASAARLSLAPATPPFAECLNTTYCGERQGAKLARIRRRGDLAISLRCLDIRGERLADSANLIDHDRVYATIKDDAAKLDILFVNAGIGSFAAQLFVDGGMTQV